MKATHTAEYFEKHKEYLFEKYKKECDFEYDLSIQLPDFSALAEETRKAALNIYIPLAAKKVAEEATKELKEKIRQIKDIKEGRVSLGYTTHVQEISAWHDLTEGFEFSCYMLSQFKKKYNIE